MSEWSLDKVGLGVLRVTLHACGFWWLIDRAESNGRSGNWDRRRAFWVVGWLLALTAMWMINPEAEGLRIFFGLLAGWRLLEVCVTGLGTALAQEQQVRARSLVTIAIYGVQLTLIFAILYHSFAATDFVTNSAPAAHLASSDYLYISWTNITSLGNSTYSPTSEVARFLEVGTTTAGILLLGVLLAFGINEVKDPTTPPPTAPAANPPASGATG